jgi:myo-inositol catabolism protein IolC
LSTNHIYMLAFDHEVQFDEVFVTGATPTAEERDLIRQVKKVVFKGVQEAVKDGVPIENAAVLVDVLYGADVADEAHESGIAYSMPVDPPVGGVILPANWQEHLKRYRPTWAKPLLWYNVEGDRDKNAGQIERTKVLQDWLHNNDQKLLLEILVPAEPHQVEATGGDQTRYEAEYLPKLITAAMEEIYSAGIRPEVWKVEGVPTVEGSRAIGEVATATGAECLVLGRAADAATVSQWLSLAGSTDGYRGFAVGRTIWQQPVIDWKRNRDDDRLVGEIAQRYRQLVNAFNGNTVELKEVGLN